jgi:hypothetical protein
MNVPHRHWRSLRTLHSAGCHHNRSDQPIIEYSLLALNILALKAPIPDHLTSTAAEA